MAEPSHVVQDELRNVVSGGRAQGSPYWARESKLKVSCNRDPIRWAPMASVISRAFQAKLDCFIPKLFVRITDPLA